jgi:peroxiredoxin
MILSSDEFKHANGKLYINRITWTINDNGKIRQLWEVLDGDKVVSIVFDGLYSPIK